MHLDNKSGFDNQRYPGSALLAGALRSNHRFSSGIVERSAALFGTCWADEFEQIVSVLCSRQQDAVDVAKGYADFAVHSMRLQAAFEVEGKYKDKSHQQAASEVYFNEQHMMREYLPGLLLSHFLWPHHYRQIQFFRSAFVDAMRVSGAASFIEVGVGTGLYSSLVLRSLPAVSGVGFDISPSSKKFSETLMQNLGLEGRYRVELRDVITEPVEPKTSWLICVEVLEHLDDPLSFLVGLRRNMAKGARAFITAALNAAHADHVYLYRKPDEVLAQLLEAGFVLEQSFAATAYGAPRPGCPVPEAAAFIVS